MTKALYYPHTQLTNESLLKNGLLLWDQVQTIVPSRQIVEVERASSVARQAQEILVQRRVPSEEEKIQAQIKLEELLQSGALHRICAQKQIARQRGNDRPHRNPYADERMFRIFRGKFRTMTWEMLEQEGLASFQQGDGQVQVPANLGFLMMTLLADACAGTQIEKITDRTEAYSWLADLRAQELGSESVKGLSPDQVATAYERLISISVSALGAEQVPIERLIAMRQREARSHADDYSNWRRSYHKVLREFLARIGKEAKTTSDYLELEAEFKAKVRDDVSSLRSELGLATSKALWSKEFVVSTVAAAGAFVEPISALTVLGSAIGLLGVIPLLGARAGYRGARKQALDKHFSSWIYVATPSKIASKVQRLVSRKKI